MCLLKNFCDIKVTISTYNKLQSSFFDEVCMITSPLPVPPRSLVFTLIFTFYKSYVLGSVISSLLALQYWLGPYFSHHKSKIIEKEKSKKKQKTKQQRKTIYMNQKKMTSHYWDVRRLRITRKKKHSETFQCVFIKWHIHKVCSPRITRSSQDRTRKVYTK